MMQVDQLYRRDIEGLRAVAVIAVVLFHAFPGVMAGGFLGVDLFFVVSGYLITGILYRELVFTGRISWLNFIIRRIRRIMPMLVTVLAATLCVGFFILLPQDYASTARSAAYAVLGAGNFYFLANTGYFDQTASLLPLLHTWSLGVEEQFYLVWPFVLWFAFSLTGRGRRRSRLIAALALPVVISLVCAIYLSSLNPSEAFYLSGTRAWELGAGGILAISGAVPKTAWHALISVGLGVVVIIASVVLFESTDLFSVVPAVAIVVGTCLVIWGGGKANAFSEILGRNYITYVGKISYSIYLWHWPVLVLYRHYSFGLDASIAETSFLLLVTLGLSIASYHFIENRARYARVGNFRVIASAITASVLLIVASYAVSRTSGMNFRIPDNIQDVSDIGVMWNWPCPKELTPAGLGVEGCSFGANWDSARHRTLVWGDSHADHLLPLLQQVVPKDTAVFSLGLCASFMGGRVHTTNPVDERTCRETREKILRWLKEDLTVDTVVLSSAWTARSRRAFIESVPQDAEEAARILEVGLSETVAEVSRPGRRVVVVADIPPYPSNSPVICEVGTSIILRRACVEGAIGTSEEEYKRQRYFTNPAIERVVDANSGAIALFPGNSMCIGQGRCLTFLSGQFLYRDSGHFRRNLPSEVNYGLAKFIGLDSIWENRGLP